MLIYVRDNLMMRSLAKSDAAKVYSVVDNNRDYLRTWLPWVDGTDAPAVIENVIASWETDYENKKDVVLGIFENGEYIGNIGLHDLKCHNNSGMVGYWLTETHQGRGIITDCVRALTDVGFDIIGLNRIYIHCAEENKKSRAIPERLGFVQEGVFQDGECLYGTFHNLVVYGMVKRNWQKSAACCLVVPALEHKEAALEYKQEHIDCGEPWIHGSGGFMKADNYEGWLQKITAAQTAPQTGWVKGSTYFLFVGDRITGTIQIRHTLNDELLNAGGHIGYGIRPSARRKGYGAKMLALALEKCRELGIEKVLVTCNKGNTGSAKTVLKNGGVLENEFIEENGNVVERYWITLIG